jgi:hypothetical protein
MTGKAKKGSDERLVWLLTTRNLLREGFMVLWMGVSCFVFHVGMAWVKGWSLGGCEAGGVDAKGKP